MVTPRNHPLSDCALHQDPDVVVVLQLAAFAVATFDEPKVLTDTKVHRIPQGEIEDVVWACDRDDDLICGLCG